jgi:hypothetical protein
MTLIGLGTLACPIGGLGVLSMRRRSQRHIFIAVAGSQAGDPVATLVVAMG